MKRLSEYAMILILAAALFCGCRQNGHEKTVTSQISQSSVLSSAQSSAKSSVEPSVEPSDPEKSPPAVSSMTVQTGSGKPADEPVKPEKPGKPDSAELMYVTRQKYSKKKPSPDAERSEFYDVGQTVYVVGRTENGYFQLSSGDYISCAYVKRTPEFYTPDKVRDNDFQKAPGELTRRSGGYRSDAALRYAEAHWYEATPFCAEFVSECLTAGGLKYDIASATELYNALTLNKNGTSFEVGLNADGTVTVPEYVQPGDVIFYYCGAENLMVHAALYSGSDPSGKASAYAHNPSSAADSPLTYKEYCPGTCGVRIEKAVIVCLNGVFFE